MIYCTVICVYMLVLLRNIVKFKLYEFVFKCTDGLHLRFCFAQELFEFDIIVLCKCLPIMFVRAARIYCYCQRLAFSNCMSGQFALSCLKNVCSANCGNVIYIFVVLHRALLQFVVK